MPSNDTTRWNLTISKETDVALRSHLAQRGMKKGDLSAFVEEAVRWRVLDQAIAEAREGFADLPADDAQALIDEATNSVRDAMRAKLQRLDA